MGWTLVISEDETFQREAISRLSAERPVVGATGDNAARSLVRAVNVDKILVDALDEVGARFLSTLRTLPRKALPGIDVVAVGPAERASGFHAAPTVDAAVAGANATQAA